MKKKDAEYIALTYIIGWATLNIDIREDYFDSIPKHHFPDGYQDINTDGDCSQHYANEQERALISNAFAKVADELLRKRRKLTNQNQLR